MLRVSVSFQSALGSTQPSVQLVPVSLPGVGGWSVHLNHSPGSSAEVKARVAQDIYSISGPSWPVLGRIYLLPKTCLLHKRTKPITDILPKAGLLGRYLYAAAIPKCLPAQRDRVPTSRVPGHSTYRMIRLPTPVNRPLAKNRRVPKCVVVVAEN